MDSVRDKIVLITGGSGVIGGETARLFAKHGSRLALVGRNVENLQKVADDCIQLGVSKDNVLTITADVTKEDDVQRIVDETISKFSRIDVLVNNAGILKKGSIEQASMDLVHEIFNVNLFALIHLTKLAIPHLKETKGCIVNNSSCSGIRPWVSGAVYGMAKAALDMFTATLAIELGSSGVRVNSVNTVFVRSPMPTEFFDIPEHKKDQFFKDLGAVSPQGRIAEPSDVANAILFLASDAASYINGTILPVDGGTSKTTSWFQSDLEFSRQ